MKKIYTLAFASLTAIAALAQKQNPTNEFKAVPRPVLAQDQAQHTDAAASQVRGGTSFWCEDFANGIAGNNTVGAWTIEDSGTTPIWMQADANSPAGQFSSNIAALASPTASNGWMIFDCDLYNADLSAVETVTGSLTTPALDMSALSSVIVDYYHYFRYCCFSASPLTIEVSIDGGTTWVSFPAHGSFIPSANTLSANALHTAVDVSCVAAGESNVRIRWGYNTAVNDGYSHYFWGIDDVCIYENTVANDLKIAQVTNGDIFNIWEYRVTPMEQVVAAADGGVLAGVIFRNNGYIDQTNTSITVDILDDAMNVLTTVNSDVFTALSTSGETQCPAPFYDTLWINTNWAPATTGLYYVRASILSADFTDGTPTDNTMMHSIEFSEYEYGHDNRDSLTIQVGPADADAAGFFQPCGWGNFFTFPNAGSTAYGLTVEFGANATETCYMEALLVEIPAGGTLNTNGSEIGFNEFNLTQGWIDATYPQYFPYSDPVDIDETLVYFCGVRNPDEAAEELWVLAWDDSDTDNSTGSFEQTGAGDFVWFSSQTFTPSVRLILAQQVGVTELANELGLSGFAVSPNPASSVAKVNFNLANPRYIAYEVRSIDGKLIEWKNAGQFMAGQNVISLDVNAYAAGNYIVNLVVDGKNMFTQQMSVVKN
jgi:hypothetical protein